MHVVPRSWDGEIVALGFKDPREGVVLQCEVASPPSMKGRACALYLTEEQRDQLLVQLRSEAIRARRSAS